MTVNAASDDESGSSAAVSQVWSAGRRSDRRSGEPAESTGTSQSVAPVCEHDPPAKHRTMTTVSSFFK